MDNSWYLAKEITRTIGVGTYQERTGELLPAGSYYYLVEVRETGKVKRDGFI